MSLAETQLHTRCDVLVGLEGIESLFSIYKIDTLLLGYRPFLVRGVGFEPTTPRFQSEYSTRLSHPLFLAEDGGVEPRTFPFPWFSKPVASQPSSIFLYFDTSHISYL